ncbi:Transposase [Phytophthora megakarya]|uniref:Transposase n=1 Tax=Phytophthora megakarya TaxID=4795 RepID=A0A225VMF1_9STRA|nr:Transposase [Phytophthora megakarya]
MDVKGFVGWGDADETFMRISSHEVFKTKTPFLNPWPLPRSIVVMDNSRFASTRNAKT